MSEGLAFKNRVALVTGGSRGIGAATAIALARAGCDVAVSYRARGDEAEAVAVAVRALGRRAVSMGCDFAVGAQVKALIAEVEGALGPIDLLVNNAGVALTSEGETESEDDFDRTIAVNLKSVFLCIEAVLPGMRARGFGRVINISSVAARTIGMVSVAYNASKAGLEGLTRGYAGRVAKHGITVNAIAPGPIDTEMGAPLKEAGIASRVPVGRMGTPEEVAQAVVMVAGNAFMTGQTVAVNGGVAFL